MAVAKEKVMAIATKNAAPVPSRDLVTTSLVLVAEALAALKAAMAAALVLAAEAAAALMADNANGSDGSAAIVGVASLAMGGGVIN